MVHVYDLQGGQWVTGFQAAAGMSLLNLYFQRRFLAVCLVVNLAEGAWPRRLPRPAISSTWRLDRPAWASAQASPTKDALVCLYFCIISILILYQFDLRYCKWVLVPSIPSICCDIIRAQKIWHARWVWRRVKLGRCMLYWLSKLPCKS